MKPRQKVIEIGSAFAVPKLKFGAESFDVIQLSNVFDLGFQLLDRVTTKWPASPSSATLHLDTPMLLKLALLPLSLTATRFPS